MEDKFTYKYTEFIKLTPSYKYIHEYYSTDEFYKNGRPHVLGFTPSTKSSQPVVSLDRRVTRRRH